MPYYIFTIWANFEVDASSSSSCNTLMVASSSAITETTLQGGSVLAKMEDDILQTI